MQLWSTQGFIAFGVARPATAIQASGKSKAGLRIGVEPSLDKARLDEGGSRSARAPLIAPGDTAQERRRSAPRLHAAASFDLGRIDPPHGLLSNSYPWVYALEPPLRTG